MIAIGSDHGGVELKDYLVRFLRAKGVGVRDFDVSPLTIRILAGRFPCGLPEANPTGEF